LAIAIPIEFKAISGSADLELLLLMKVEKQHKKEQLFGIY
jgi:hypothetical protein